MNEYINGKDCLFSILDGDSYIPYICAKEVSIATTAALVETLTVGAGVWNKPAYQSLSYTIQLSGVLVLNSTTGFTGFDFLANQTNFVNVNWQLQFIDTAGVTKTARGQSVIESVAFTLSAGQLAADAISLPGYGSFTLIDGDYDCGAEITDIDWVEAGLDVTITMAVTVDTAYVSYIISRSAGVALTGTAIHDGSGTIVFVRSEGPGTVTAVIATPYCSNDIAGAEFTETEPQEFTPGSIILNSILNEAFALNAIANCTVGAGDTFDYTAYAGISLQYRLLWRGLSLTFSDEYTLATNNVTIDSQTITRIPDATPYWLLEFVVTVTDTGPREIDTYQV